MSTDAARPRETAARVTADDVDAAAERLAGVVSTTPVERSVRLSERTGAHVWLKREDLQVVRSYKARGAYNLIAQLDAEARAAGVVTASAGNHAQGVAFACAALGVRGRVHLPRTTPRQKRDRIASIGGDAIEMMLDGETYDDVSAAAADEALQGATLVPAFDDPRTIAGQGTVLREAFDQLAALGEPLPDVVVVPVGGGGLLAGSVAWLRERHPHVRVVGVEPAGATSMAAALEAGEPVTLQTIDTFVDGAAVRRVGRHTFDTVAGSAPTMLSVPEGRICSEMLDLYQSDGIIAEPAGALATASLGGALDVEPGSRVLCILSGGNNDVSRYADVVERALVHEGRKHYFLVEFPQEPGALRRFLDEVLGPDDDITLFEYVKHSNRETGPALVGVELSRAEDLAGLLERMDAAPPRIERIESESPLFRFLL
ncbi:threonine ammonia-lyase IlvA [Aeromicrobium erythreum]|uniref:L-threonine dehydratase n=1 Tax=Aeromicrobium erythreum TaxID=2041 RepID=A0A0U4CE42_9ACTN|nr:threonine ammonia-lyase IlvA [Aeromicrobium erythreum]ALX03717.1 threonine dehydratase [Aeromicrobium erythreum]